MTKAQYKVIAAIVGEPVWPVNTRVPRGFGDVGVFE
jgi:hypothetical protein